MIGTTLRRAPAIPQPGWTLANKELGRVDALAIGISTIYAGGNFTTVQAISGRTTGRRYFVAFDLAIGKLAALTGPQTARVYGVGLAAAAGRTAIYTAGADGLWRHDQSGWKRPISGKLRDVCCADGDVFTAAEDGTVQRLEPPPTRSGVGWSAKVNGAARSLACDIAHLYVAVWTSNSRGYVACLDRASGRTLWATPAGNPVLDVALGAVDLVYVAEGGPGGTARAVESTTGHTAWFHATDGNCQACCMAIDGSAVFGMHGDNVAVKANAKMAEYGSGGRTPRHKAFALDAQTGDLLDWDLPLTSRGGSPLGVWALESGSGVLAAGGDFTGPRARLAVVDAR